MTVLRGATLIDGTGAPPVRDAVIVLRDGRIECAGPRAMCPVPAGIDTVDARGLWITPGLVDAHVHYSQTGWADGRPDALDLRARFPYEQTERELRMHPERFHRAYLGSGVTAVFDVGGYPWTLDLQESSKDDLFAPHYQAAGPLLSTLDHWLNLPAERQFIYMANDSVTRAGVRFLKSRGASAVKVWFIPNAPRPFDEMEKLVAVAGDEARKVGLPLIVHATGLREAKAALRAGASLLVHSVWDTTVDDQFIQLAKTNHTIYCPTITVIDGYTRMYESARSGNPPEMDDSCGCLDSLTRAHVASTPVVAKELYGAKVPSRPARPERRRFMDQNLLIVQRAGIPIAMGTDAGNPLTLHGVSVHAEMEAMQQAGMKPMDVIVASTRGGAMAMGRLANFGTIEKGKAADLLVLDADPLADVRNTRRIRFVVRGGVVRKPEEFRQPH